MKKNLYLASDIYNAHKVVVRADNEEEAAKIYRDWYIENTNINYIGKELLVVEPCEIEDIVSGENDVTNKYKEMIYSFDREFLCAMITPTNYDLSKFSKKLKNKDKGMLKAIELVDQLAHLLRNKKIKIIKTE